MQKKEITPNAKRIGKCVVAQKRKCIWDVFDEENKRAREFDEKLRNAKAAR